jgi:hypothetical protein
MQLSQPFSLTNPDAIELGAITAVQILEKVAPPILVVLNACVFSRNDFCIKNDVVILTGPDRDLVGDFIVSTR